MIQSRVVVPKKTFFPCRLLYLISRNSFFQSTEFLYFTKVPTANHSSMDTVFFRRAIANINFIYTAYLTDISIESVLFFQRSTCSHTIAWHRHYFRRPLAVIYYFPIFKGIELIRNSSCNHPFDE